MASRSAHPNRCSKAGLGWSLTTTRGKMTVMAVEMRKISSGDEGIDGTHKHLVDLAAAIDGLCDAGDYGAITDDAMDALLKIATTVFDLELAAMEELSYLKIHDHTEEHEILISTIEIAVNKVKTRSPALIKDAVAVMLFSLSGHIETMDIPLADQISKKIRKPAVAARRSTDPVNRPAPPTTHGHRGDSGPPPGKTSDDGINLKTIIVNTYAATLLDLKISRGMTGEGAKNAAYEVVARAVNKTTGKKINGEFVKQIILSR